MQGVISAHPRGFGFVTQDSGEAYFVSPPQMRALVPGDRVHFSLTTSAHHPQLSAIVHEVLQRPETFWLGQLEAGERGHRLRADDAVHVPIVVDGVQRIDASDVVQVRIPANESVGQPWVRASVVANLGPRNDRDFDIHYAIAKWRLPVEFGEQALAQARGHAEPSLARALELDFSDLTHLPFITIDGETTTDFDDALCLVDQGAHWSLHVAVAHVSHYVSAGSPLDVEARARGTSVYLPDRSIPMLPPELSSGLCSLNPDVLRYAVVCSLKYSKQGTLGGYAFCQAIVRSAARLTYRQVSSGSVPEQAGPVLEGLWQWFDTQQAARAQRGLVEYRAEEPRLVIGADGAYGVEWVGLGKANELIEEAMLAANRAAAAHLTLLGAGLLFRHQEGLAAQKWEDTREWLAEQGIAAPAVPTRPDLRRLLAGVQGAAIQPQVEYRLRRAMAPAVYDEAQSSHYSLGFHAYSHFTSPIRRYADLVVHRMLLGEAIAADAGLAEHLSARAKAARQASRFSWDRLKRRLVWRSGQREHEAQVISLNAKGLKAALARWEVLVAVDAGELERGGWSWDGTAEAWRRQDVLLGLGSKLPLRLLALKDDGPVCELRGQPA